MLIKQNKTKHNSTKHHTTQHNTTQAFMLFLSFLTYKRKFKKIVRISPNGLMMRV